MIKMIHIIFFVALLFSGCSTPTLQDNGVFTSVGVDEAYRRGVSAHNAGDLVQAEAHLRDALQVNPRYLAALIELGWVIYDGGEGERALEVFDRALSIRSNSAIALSGRAASLLLLGRFEEAMASANQSFTIEATPEALFLFAITSLETNHDTARAIVILEQSIRSWPDRDDVRVHLSRLYRNEGLSGEAVSILERGLLINSESGRLLETLASLYMEMEQWEQAVGLWQRYVSVRPSEVQPWIEIARAQLEMGNPRLSIQTLEQAAQLVSGHIDIALLRGRAAYEQGYIARAQEEVLHVLSLEPDHLQGLFLHAQLMHTSGHVDLALVLLSHAIQRYPQEEFLAVEMGRYLALRGDHHEAIAVMESFWPFEGIEGRQLFLEICLDGGELGRVLSQLKVILTEQPELMEERLRLVQLVLNQPEQEEISLHEMLVFAREAFALSGGNRLIYRLVLVDVLMNIEEYEEVHMLLEEGLSDLPNNPELQQRLNALQGRNGER